MSKALPANCAAGVVQIENTPIDDAVILSKGVGSSTGLAIIDEDKTTYVASSAQDIETALTSIIAALTEIATALTAIGAGMTGPTTAPPGTLPTSVATITSKIGELTTLKGALK